MKQDKVTYLIEVGAGIGFVLYDKLQILESLNDRHSPATKSATYINNLRIEFPRPRVDTQKLPGVYPGSTGKGYLCTLSDLWFNI